MIAIKAVLLRPPDFFSSSPLEPAADAEAEAERETETRDGTRLDAVEVIVVTGVETAMLSLELEGAAEEEGMMGASDEVEEGIMTVEVDEGATELDGTSAALDTALLSTTALLEGMTTAEEEIAEGCIVSDACSSEATHLGGLALDGTGTGENRTGASNGDAGSNRCR